MTIFGRGTTPRIAKQRLEDDPNARIVEYKVDGSCTTIHFTLAKQPLFAIFDDGVLAGVWDLSPDRGRDEVAQDMMEQRGW
tara:strand:+ start:506 stop:748 length:243 start_codon:yes stop_codon:yes gene_type:complete